MSNEIRQRALRVLRDHENQTHTAVHNAIIDLRRNAELGDERILRPFLNHYDPMVVAATLYTLFEVHNQQGALRPLLERLVTDGDERESDDLDCPIQCEAISRLARFGKQDATVIAALSKVAEDPTTPDTPRKRAWQELAQLYDVEWPAEAAEEMILRPESEASERIRQTIRQAMANDVAG